jgi:hypothetical protein
MGAQISRQRARRDRVITEHGERETEGDASMHKKNDTFWNTKDRVWVMERSESGEEETFRVDCADEEA